MTWRGLYASSNGWRGLRPGCFEMLALPCCSEWYRSDNPTQCILDSQELGWLGAAGGGSELLVVDTFNRLQVTLQLSLYASELTKLLLCIWARSAPG